MSIISEGILFKKEKKIMAKQTKNKKGTTRSVPDATEQTKQGRETAGLRTAKVITGEMQSTQDYARLIVAMVLDAAEGKVSAILVNSTVNAGRLLVKMAELNMKYGRPANAKRVQPGPTINLLTGQAE